MEHQTLVNDHSKKSASSDMSGSDGHEDSMPDLRSLALGQLLWVRGFKCSWWPAQVVDEKNISENIIVNDRIEGGVLVRFYGSYTYAWVDPFADLCKFRESFIENGSDHVKAFQKSVEEILVHVDVNKASAQVDVMKKSSAASSQCNMPGGGEELEKGQRQRKQKENVTKTAKLDEAEKTSQGKQKEKVPQRGKVEEAEKIQSPGKKKEKTPKNVKGGEPKKSPAQGKIQSPAKKKEKTSKNVEGGEPKKSPAQGKIQSPGKKKEKTSKNLEGGEPKQSPAQGKRKAEVLDGEKGQKPVQTGSEEKRKGKSPKVARSDETQQIQSKGKSKKANNNIGEKAVQIESQGKEKVKNPKNGTGREQQKIQSPEKRKENSIKCAKGDEPEQTPGKGKKNEKVSSDGSQKSRGKTEKAPSNAVEVREDGSEKMVRQMRLMRLLGLAAPVGSPFSV